MSDSVFFIQVLDSSKLKDRSAKLEQFRNLGDSIQGIIPVKNSRIDRYMLLAGKESDDLSEMIGFIKTELELI